MTKRDLTGLAAFLGVCLAVSAGGGLATASSVDTWYQVLVKPGFTPPDWVFAPVWTLLYVMIGVAGWRLWRQAPGAERAMALRLYWAQLALNLGWSVLFFGLRSPAAGLLCIALLIVAIAGGIAAFSRVDRLAAVLFAPYLLWVIFAGLLNASIWSLNSV